MADKPKESTSFSKKKKKKETFGLDVKQLKLWNQIRIQQQLDTEIAKQEIAVARVRGFLDAVASVIRLQSWWRMIRVRKKYRAWLADRLGIKRKYYRSWCIFWKSERMHMHQVLGKFFEAWKDEVQDEKRLKKLVMEFFKNCIKRMRLSPQACMAFFNPGEWSQAVAQSDMLKIRRMMLQKLMTGWRMETRELKNTRYKASQILARMMRRTRGPLWVKESTLVCFHMWHRYTGVKRAFRKGEPDPRYSNPHLPQWTKLFKDLTVSRIKKKRTLENGHYLTQKRAFVKWMYLMTVDRSKPVTPLAVAISHYHNVLITKVYMAWQQLIRERGELCRYRNKLFYIWKTWAPKHRKLRNFNGLAIEWLRIKRQRKSFDAMISICLTVVGARTEKIKELRRNFYDRKVMICAYALMNKNEHVLMIDYWRRLVTFYQRRKAWKVFQWQYNYAYHQFRAREILHAWREVTVTAVRVKAANRASSQMESFLSEQNSFLSGRSSPSIADSMDEISSVESQEKQENELIEQQQNQQNVSDDMSLTSLRVNSKGEIITPPKQKKEKRKKDYSKMMRGFGMIAQELLQNSLSGQLETIPTSYQLFLFGLALAIVYKKLPELSNKRVEDVYYLAIDKISTSSFQPNPSLLTATNPMMNPTTLTNGRSFSAMILNPPKVVGNSHIYRARYIEECWKPDIQRKLQDAVDQVNLTATINCLSSGAIVEEKFIRQASRHIGDHYLPIFVVLLLGSLPYIANRIIASDRKEIVAECHHPVSAFFTGNHILRWEKCDLTTREISAVTQNMLTMEMMGGQFKSYYLWRTLALYLLDRKTEELAKTCKQLQANRTMDEEVGEIIKRNRVEKLISMRFSITNLLGESIPWDINMRMKSVLPELVRNPLRNSIFVITQDSIKAKRSIYHVLREYTLLTGRLANEAKALRTPLLERDQRLLVNGFLARARKDFLALRQECMTSAQLEAQRIQQEKEALKAKKLSDKAILKKRKERKKEMLKKKKRKQRKNKKNKKGSSGSGSSPTSRPTTPAGRKSGGLNDIDSDDEDDDDNAYDTAGSDNTMTTNEIDDIELHEAEFDSQHLFLIEDLYDQSNLFEENETLDEEAFQRRISDRQYPVYGETWSPFVQLREESNRQRHGQRIFKELKSCLKRLFHALAIGQWRSREYHEMKDKYKGIGFYFLDKAINDPLYRKLPLWSTACSNYWNYAIIKDRMIKELAMIEGIVYNMKKDIRLEKNRNTILNNDISNYEKYLKMARKEILQIATKQSSKRVTDQEEKQDKYAMITKVDRNLNQNKKKIQDLSEKLKLSEIYLAVNNLESIFELFPPKEEDEQLQQQQQPQQQQSSSSPKPTSTPTQPTPRGRGKGKQQEDHSHLAALKLIEEKKNELLEIKKISLELENKKKKVEKDAKDHLATCLYSDRLLEKMALERFNMMVDVQQLLLRSLSSLDKTDDKKDELLGQRLNYFHYLKILQYYFQKVIIDKGTQLIKEAEEKRFQELLFHREISSSRDEKDEQELKQGGVGGSSSDDHHQLSPSGSRKKSMKSQNSTRRMTTKSSKKASTSSLHSTFSLSDIPMAKEEGDDGDNSAADEEGDEQLEELMEEETGQESSDRKDEGGSSSAGISRDMKRASMILKEKEAAAAALEASNQKERPPRTIDEEIAWMHYNSPEEIAKRERELELLAEKQAQDMADQDLRIRIFQEYWQSFPRQEKVNNNNKSNKGNKANKPASPPPLVITDEDTASSIIERNRTQKMWDAIGKSHWRDKAEKIRALIAKEMETSGQDITSLQNIRIIPKEGPDPLDDEFNYEPSPRLEPEHKPRHSEFERRLYIPFQTLEKVVWFHGSTYKLRTATKLSVSLRELHLLHRKMSEVSGGGEENASLASGSTGATMTTSKVEAEVRADEFAITGQTEYFRIKQGYLSRTKNAEVLPESDSRSFSYESRTGRRLILREVENSIGSLEFSDEFLDDDLSETSSLHTPSMTSLDKKSGGNSAVGVDGTGGGEDMKSQISALSAGDGDTQSVKSALSTDSNKKRAVIIPPPPSKTESPKASPMGTTSQRMASFKRTKSDVSIDSNEDPDNTNSNSPFKSNDSPTKRTDSFEKPITRLSGDNTLANKRRMKAKQSTYAVSSGTELLKATKMLTEMAAKNETNDTTAVEGPSLQLKREASQLLKSSGVALRASSFMMKSTNSNKKLSSKSAKMETTETVSSSDLADEKEEAGSSDQEGISPSVPHFLSRGDSKSVSMDRTNLTSPLMYPTTPEHDRLSPLPPNSNNNNKMVINRLGSDLQSLQEEEQSLHLQENEEDDDQVEEKKEEGGGNGVIAVQPMHSSRPLVVEKVNQQQPIANANNNDDISSSRRGSTRSITEPIVIPMAIKAVPISPSSSYESRDSVGNLINEASLVVEALQRGNATIVAGAGTGAGAGGSSRSGSMGGQVAAQGTLPLTLAQLQQQTQSQSQSQPLTQVGNKSPSRRGSISSISSLQGQIAQQQFLASVSKDFTAPEPEYKAIRDPRGHGGWDLRPSSPPKTFSSQHGLFLNKPKSALQIAGKGFITPIIQPSTPPPYSSRLHHQSTSPGHNALSLDMIDDHFIIPDDYKNENERHIMNDLGLPRHHHQTSNYEPPAASVPTTLMEVVRELEQSSRLPRAEEEFLPADQFGARITFFPSNFRQRAPGFDPVILPSSRKSSASSKRRRDDNSADGGGSGGGSSKSDPSSAKPTSLNRLSPSKRSASSSRGSQSPSTPSKRSGHNSSNKNKTPVNTPATSQEKKSRRTMIFDDNDDSLLPVLDKPIPVVSPLPRKSLTWDDVCEYPMEDVLSKGPQLDEEDLQALTQELQRFVASREDSLSAASSPPQTRGKLRTREKQFQALRSAEDNRSNFYTQIVPSPSSPDYSLTIKDFKGDVIVRVRPPSRDHHHHNNKMLLNRQDTSKSQNTVSTGVLSHDSLLREYNIDIGDGGSYNDDDEYYTDLDLIEDKQQQQQQEEVVRHHVKEGVADFWINVKSTIPVTASSHAGHGNGGRREEETNNGEDDVSPLKPVIPLTSLAEDKAKDIHSMVIQGMNHHPMMMMMSSDHQHEHKQHQQHHPTVWSENEEKESLRGHTSHSTSLVVDNTKDKKNKNKNKKHNVQNSRYGHMGDDLLLPAAGAAVTTMSQIVRDIANDGGYLLHTGSSSNVSDEATTDHPLPPLTLSATAAVLPQQQQQQMMISTPHRSILFTSSSILNPNLLKLDQPVNTTTTTTTTGNSKEQPQDVAIEASALPIHSRYNNNNKTSPSQLQEQQQQQGLLSLSSDEAIQAVIDRMSSRAISDSFSTPIPEDGRYTEEEAEMKEEVVRPRLACVSSSSMDQTLHTPSIHQPDNSPIDIMYNSTLLKEPHELYLDYDDEVEEEEWEREAEQELRKAYSMSALPASQLPFYQQQQVAGQGPQQLHHTLLDFTTATSLSSSQRILSKGQQQRQQQQQQGKSFHKLKPRAGASLRPTMLPPLPTMTATVNTSTNKTLSNHPSSSLVLGTITGSNALVYLPSTKNVKGKNGNKTILKPLNKI